MRQDAGIGILMVALGLIIALASYETSAIITVAGLIASVYGGLTISQAAMTAWGRRLLRQDSEREE